MVTRGLSLPRVFFEGCDCDPVYRTPNQKRGKEVENLDLSVGVVSRGPVRQERRKGCYVIPSKVCTGLQFAQRNSSSTHQQ